jgi:TetR/AcrR family transcriptional regulator, transcriptional repressor for nem operon
MARPRVFDIDTVTRQAMNLFWRRGYVATAMSDIYEATGLKPGNLYATFGDKDGLFRAAFEAYAGHFRATLPHDADGLAAIRAWLGMQASLAVEDPERKGCLIVNTNAEREAHSPETRALAAERLAEIRTFFAEHLAIARSRGEIEREDGLADFLVGTVLAIMQMARSGLPPEAVRAMAENAARVVAGESAGRGPH